MCGAAYGVPSPDRSTSVTAISAGTSIRAGTLDVAIPRCGPGRTSRTGCWPPGTTPAGTEKIMGLQFTSAEDGAGWLGFFRNLTARGLSGVALATSDAHRGLTEAIGATLPGAVWQRCRTTTPRI